MKLYIQALLRAPHGDIPLLAMETTAVQQVCSEGDPVHHMVGELILEKNIF